jgi:hypothetical protein
MIRAFDLQVHLKALPYAINSGIVGILFGIGMGMMDHYSDKQLFRNKPMGQVIVGKIIISIVFLFACLLFRKYVLFSLIVAPAIGRAFLRRHLYLQLSCRLF